MTLLPQLLGVPAAELAADAFAVLVMEFFVVERR